MFKNLKGRYELCRIQNNEDNIETYNLYLISYIYKIPNQCI